MKFLRSLPSEWNTHVVVWRNKPDLDTMSFDDLYNNFKIVEQEVKGTAYSSSSSSSQNMAFVSSPRITNEFNTAYEVNTANTKVSPASTQVSTASTQVSTNNLSDATVYAVLANQPNGSQLVHEDLEQIHKDDLEEMDLKWQSSNVECFQRHRVGTLGKECEEPRTKIAGIGIKTAIEEPLEGVPKPEFEGYGPLRLVRSVCEVHTLKRLTAITIKGKGWPNTAVLNTVRENQVNAVKASACWVWRPTKLNSALITFKRHNYVDARGHPQKEDQGYVDSGCSRHMTGNMSYLSDFKEFDGGYVTFGGGAKGGKITVHRKNNMYNVDMKNIVLKETLTCLVANATLDESMLWHRRLATKDETSGILKSFITEVENLVDKKVKIIRCDNGTEFKNRVMSEFCEKKGIKKEFSVARTPQQNGVAERRNRTLIEAARTMLADSKLPTTFWAEAVNTACYVQNRVLVVKPHNKTPYELFRGRTPALSFMRPFGCHVTILNTLDYLGKFDGKSDEGFFVGYSMNSKAFRVYNIRTRKVEENLHIRFLEDKPIIAGDGPKWLFDIDVLTKSMNYVPVVAGTNSNDFVGTKESISAGHSSKEIGSSQDYILMPLWKDGSLFDSSSKNASNDEPQPPSDARKKDDEGVCKESGIDDQERPKNSPQDVNTAGPSINTEPDMFSLGDNATLEATHADFFSDKTKVYMINITTTYLVPSTPNTRIHTDHSLDHVISDVQSGVQTRRMTKTTNKQGFISAIYEGKTYKDLHTYLFACFLSQEEPKRIAKAPSDTAWVEAMQEELLYLQGGESTLLDNGFHRGKIDQTLFIKKQKGDILLVQVYVDDIIFGFTKKELCTEFEKLMHDKFQMSSIGELTFFLGLQVNQKEDRIFISKDKYVADILRKFSFTDARITSTPMDTEKPLLKDLDGDDVNVHLYRSMIRSFMYLTSSKLDIMFAVCACARF
ncbi:putative ribonuclease H-like domain-containing protein [Tanacetum coccineum]